MDLTTNWSLTVGTVQHRIGSSRWYTGSNITRNHLGWGATEGSGKIRSM